MYSSLFAMYLAMGKLLRAVFSAVIYAKAAAAPGRDAEYSIVRNTIPVIIQSPLDSSEF